jgi:hypothetical protein
VPPSPEDIDHTALAFEHAGRLLEA